jgi:hypothetical protein
VIRGVCGVDGAAGGEGERSAYHRSRNDSICLSDSLSGAINRPEAAGVGGRPRYSRICGRYTSGRLSDPRSCASLMAFTSCQELRPETLEPRDICRQLVTFFVSVICCCCCFFFVFFLFFFCFFTYFGFSGCL